MSKETESFYERLAKAQAELVAPKGQYNDFSNFAYRSAEDILLAVKPINLKYHLHLLIIDEIVEVADRIYIKAIATITDTKDKTAKSTTKL